MLDSLKGLLARMGGWAYFIPFFLACVLLACYVVTQSARRILRGIKGQTIPFQPGQVWLDIHGDHVYYIVSLDTMTGRHEIEEVDQVTWRPCEPAIAHMVRDGQARSESVTRFRERIREEGLLPYNP